MFTAYILSAIAGAIGNRYAGHEDGNRYLPAALFALAAVTVHGPAGLAVGGAFLLWRSIGWYGAIDMGRNEHTLARDFWVMVAIALVPAALVAWASGTWLVLVPLALAPAVCYLAAMRLLPWTPGYQHVAVAEIATGAALGLLTAYAFSVS